MARTITIKKDLVFYHAEAAIRKVLDVRLQTPHLSSYHIQPDENVGIDKELLHRIIELRDAIVRDVMQKYLEYDGTEADDELEASTANFVYSLDMPTNWRSAMLKPLATYIHNFLVKGILYDYLKDKMPDIAQAYLPEVEELQDSIESALNAREGMIKAPLQPF